MFGQTTRVDCDELSQRILNELSIKNDEGAPRKVLLVGHAVHNDFQIIDHLGLRLKELVAGVVDTH